MPRLFSSLLSLLFSLIFSHAKLRSKVRGSSSEVRVLLLGDLLILFKFEDVFEAEKLLHLRHSFFGKKIGVRLVGLRC